jgi:hypothetical protein
MFFSISVDAYEVNGLSIAEDGSLGCRVCAMDQVAPMAGGRDPPSGDSSFESSKRARSDDGTVFEGAGTRTVSKSSEIPGAS